MYLLNDITLLNILLYLTFPLVVLLNSVDPFSKKDWFDIKAPAIFPIRQIGKTLATKSQGMSKYHLVIVVAQSSEREETFWFCSTNWSVLLFSPHTMKSALTSFTCNARMNSLILFCSTMRPSCISKVTAEQTELAQQKRHSQQTDLHNSAVL